MSYWSIFWPCAAGVGAIAVAVFANTFYAADVWGGDIGDEKPVPKWQGRLVFGLVGVGFIVLGLARAFVPQH